MSIRSQFMIVRTWLPLIVVTVISCALIAGLIASQLKPTYTSEVRLLSGPALSGAIDNSDIVAGQNLAPTFAELATTRAVLQGALQATGAKMSVEELQAAISTHVPVSSGLIQLSVSAPDPKVAADLANAIAAELKNYPPGLPNPRPDSNVTLTVIDPAVPAARPEGPGVSFSAALGAVIGLVLAVSIAFLIENLRRPEPEGVLVVQS